VPATSDYRTGDLTSIRYIVFTQRELATRWGCDVSQITRWRKDGTVPGPTTFSAAGRELGWSLQWVRCFEEQVPMFAAKAASVRAAQ